MITELDRLLKKKNTADALDAPNQNRTHERQVGPTNNIPLPKIQKPNAKIPRHAIARQWLNDNPDWDLPSRMEGDGEEDGIGGGSNAENPIDNPIASEDECSD
jgi:hypothetical protein